MTSFQLSYEKVFRTTKEKYEDFRAMSPLFGCFILLSVIPLFLVAIFIGLFHLLTINKFFKPKELKLDFQVTKHQVNLHFVIPDDPEMNTLLETHYQLDTNDIADLFDNGLKNTYILDTEPFNSYFENKLFSDIAVEFKDGIIFNELIFEPYASKLIYYTPATQSVELITQLDNRYDISVYKINENFITLALRRAREKQLLKIEKV